MTVTSIQETQDRVIADLEIEQKPKELSSPAVKDLTEGRAGSSKSEGKEICNKVM
ncbi:conserved hypothetical protein [Ricinus communis]|uniref:Uncharacterized protein n=1 Tax=Ricinus communis TaxID=3988 RepID=B9RUP6_RICCO|nr:conserved hypothetical protein [Ricinus communis]